MRYNSQVSPFIDWFDFFLLSKYSLTFPISTFGNSPLENIGNDEILQISFVSYYEITNFIFFSCFLTYRKKLSVFLYQRKSNLKNFRSEILVIAKKWVHCLGRFIPVGRITRQNWKVVWAHCPSNFQWPLQFGYIFSDGRKNAKGQIAVKTNRSLFQYGGVNFGPLDFSNCCFYSDFECKYCFSVRVLCASTML